MLFKAYPEEQRDMRWVSVTLSTTATVLLALRMFTTWKNRGWFGLEDVFVVAADICLITLAAMMYTSTAYGFGSRVAEIQKSGGNVPKAMMFFFTTQIFYLLTNVFNKMAFLTLYHRIFAVKLFQRLCLVIMVAVIGGGIGFLFGTIFQCTPVYKTWRMKDVPGHCVNFVWQRWANATWNLTTDIAIFVLPMPVISRLKISGGTKIGLFVIFSMGFFICLMTALRMATLPLSLRTKEPTWESAPTNMWSFIDAAVGVICACLISLRKTIYVCWPGRWTKKGTSKRYPSLGNELSSRYKLSGSRKWGATVGSNHALDPMKPGSSYSNGPVYGLKPKGLGETYVNVMSRGDGELGGSESQECIIEGITVTKDVQIMRHNKKGRSSDAIDDHSAWR
ncbi:hypothetical protein K469DRAFT_671753 [Zopfia rhizophila CBS 207.26]|uniref:Rhodopsin domain-containing protein n=1 Tax=Zopfia rhizophila CBS 207.26 TaxID=1314779 RepID=A0A6A6DRV6_9PEZI|nr:hypothetical protein K469DRAFT_671753 [Zopfia rhizophila CBS 207.26]